MTTANQFISAARKYLGTTESPRGSNRQPFAARANHLNGYPWCASFVVAVAREVGLKLPSESAYTPTMRNGFRSVGLETRTPRPGDLAFFDFPDSVRRIQHVGIVESVGRTTVTCIEGNTSSGNGGSQANGGGVYRRTRPRTHVVAFGRPSFGAQVSILSQGSRGQAVTDLQKVLVGAGHLSDGDVDGEFGPLTENAVRAFQTQLGVEPDGQVGPATQTAMGNLFNFLSRQPAAPAKPTVKPAFGLMAPIVDALPTPSGKGVWLLDESGAVFTKGDALYYGGANGKPYFMGRKAARILADGKRYRIVATSGEVYGRGGKF